MRSRLDKSKHKFGSLHANYQLKQRDYEDWKQRKAELKEDIDHLKKELAELKEKRKAESKHITMGELDKEDKFQQLAPTRKLLMDTIKMIAYRSETAMAESLKPYLGKESDARCLLKDLYKSQADLYPDSVGRVLNVRVHHLANPRSNKAIKRFFKDLNNTEMRYPGTKLRLHFSFAGSTDPPK